MAQNMSQRAVNSAAKVRRLRDMVHRQIDLAEKGDWDEVRRLMDERADIIAELDRSRNAVLSPLRSMFLQIEKLNGELENLIGEEQERILKALSGLRKAKSYVDAYAEKEVFKNPEYLDERK